GLLVNYGQQVKVHAPPPKKAETDQADQTETELTPAAALAELTHELAEVAAELADAAGHQADKDTGANAARLQAAMDAHAEVWQRVQEAHARAGGQSPQEPAAGTVEV